MPAGRAHGDGPVAEPTVAELRAFLAVAEELHFRRAARRLGIAPPPLSQTIRRLEDKVGAVLMTRTPRAVELTEAGSELVPRARDILERMAEARTAVGRAADRGRAVRVGIMSNGFAELTGPVLEAFGAVHPHVRVDLVSVTTEPGAGVLDGVVDVALVRPPLDGDDDPRLVVEDVVLEPRVALLPRAHRSADAPEVSIADLLDDPWVATGPTLPAVRDYWAAADARDGEPVRFDVEAWSVTDVMLGVAHRRNVITSCASILRFFWVPGVVPVPITDVAAAPMSVVRLRDDRRPLVHTFAATAREVGSRMADMVPGAYAAPA